LSRLSAILRTRCPHCLQGEIFAGVWRMHTHCPNCGVVYERESGYFMNSIFIGYVLAFLLIVPILLVLYFRQVSGFWFITVTSIVLAIFSPLIFRYARVIWMHMDELMDPRRE
jgi:uncharacterized protein (DUF983 family)